MNRTRALLIRTFNRSSATARDAWQRMRGGADTLAVDLESVRHRMELFIGSLYGRSIRIETASVRAAGMLTRLANRASRGRLVEVAESDADTIRLPRMLCDSETLGTAAAQYRLLAIEHAERIVRATQASMPENDKPLERDLYLLAEAAAVDSGIARGMPRLADLIGRTRASESRQRPALRSLDSIEQEVELLTQRVLSSPPDEIPTEIANAVSPSASLSWAIETADMLRSRTRRSSRRYRGVAPVSLWGKVIGRDGIVDERSADQRMQDMLNSAAMLDTHIEQEGGATGGSPKDDANGGADEGGDSSDPDKESSALTQHMVQSNASPGSADQTPLPESEPDDDSSTDESARASAKSPSDRSRHVDGITYPEWDCNLNAYRVRGATVRTSAPVEGSADAAAETLAEHAPIVRALRQRFEALRARRIRLPRQRDGDELDLAACVSALVDIRTGNPSSGRLYVDVRPARRAIAISILVDVSGSTAQLISDGRRVIDVERVALLLASEALDAMGDRYSILTFSSNGAADVRVTHVKDFAEPNGSKVRQRINAIEPHGKTRLGAAIRHTSAQLARQPVSHRLLLLISDGKPMDTDRYFEHYAAEDTRQAIIEARAAGVHTFCLTVDRAEGSEYLAHIFGPAGHTILRQPNQLPFALLNGVRQLMTP